MKKEIGDRDGVAGALSDLGGAAASHGEDEGGVLHEGVARDIFIPRDPGFRLPQVVVVVVTATREIRVSVEIVGRELEPGVTGLVIELHFPVQIRLWGDAVVLCIESATRTRRRSTSRGGAPVSME